MDPCDDPLVLTSGTAMGYLGSHYVSWNISHPKSTLVRAAIIDRTTTRQLMYSRPRKSEKMPTFFFWRILTMYAHFRDIILYNTSDK